MDRGNNGLSGAEAARNVPKTMIWNPNEATGSWYDMIVLLYACNKCSLVL